MWRTILLISIPVLGIVSFVLYKLWVRYTKGMEAIVSWLETTLYIVNHSDWRIPEQCQDLVWIGWFLIKEEELLHKDNDDYLVDLMRERLEAKIAKQKLLVIKMKNPIYFITGVPKDIE